MEDQQTTPYMLPPQYPHLVSDEPVHQLPPGHCHMAHASDCACGCRTRRPKKHRGLCDISGILMSSIREGVAAFFYVMITLAIASNNSYDRGFLAIGEAFAYAAVSFALAGALCNPALTLAAVITGRVSIKAGLAHVVSQFIGSLLGAVCVRWAFLMDLSFALPVVMLVPQWAGFLAEFLMSYLFCMFVVTALFAGWTGVRPLLVGLGLGALVFAIGPITTACLNPWKALSVAIVTVIFNNDLWVFCVAPFVGAIVAGLMALILHLQHFHVYLHDVVLAMKAQ